MLLSFFALAFLVVIPGGDLLLSLLLLSANQNGEPKERPATSCALILRRRTITPGCLETLMKTLTIAMIGATLVTAGSVRVSEGQMLPSQRPAVMQQVEQQKMRVVERQKQLVADTDKLLSLTTALKEQVNESDKNILSIDMIRKAEEIEKLAHSIKERMKE